ncbi:MAG TPA: hypothetical protein VIV14_07250 [Gammaproteobacteria bacterium]
MKFKVSALLSAAMALPAVAYGHTPICDCFDNGDNTITCEGGFSDGASAAGIPMRVLDSSGRILIEGTMSDRSDFTFDRPDGNFRVEFEGGDGHLILIDGRDIEE